MYIDGWCFKLFILIKRKLPNNGEDLLISIDHLANLPSLTLVIAIFLCIATHYSVMESPQDTPATKPSPMSVSPPPFLHSWIWHIIHSSLSQFQHESPLTMRLDETHLFRSACAGTISPWDASSSQRRPILLLVHTLPLPTLYDTKSEQSSAIVILGY